MTEDELKDWFLGLTPDEREAVLLRLLDLADEALLTDPVGTHLAERETTGLDDDEDGTWIDHKGAPVWRDEDAEEDEDEDAEGDDDADEDAPC